MTPIHLFKLGCAITIATGLVSALGAHPATAAPWSMLFDAIRWPIDGAEGAFSSEARLVNAIHGGVLVGWGLMLFLLADSAVARDANVRRAVLAGVAAWFVVDCAGSIAAGWPQNLVPNLLFGALLAGPLLLLRETERGGARPRPT